MRAAQRLDHLHRVGRSDQQGVGRAANDGVQNRGLQHRVPLFGALKVDRDPEILSRSLSADVHRDVESIRGQPGQQRY